MSLYREVGRGRAPALVAVGLVALLVGLAAGFLAGRAAAPDPSLADAVEKVQRDARPVADALDLVPIKYGQAVRNGEVVAETEYDAAKAAVERAREGFARLRDDLAALDPEQARRAGGHLDELAALVERRAPASEVEQAADQARAAVRAAARLERS